MTRSASSNPLQFGTVIMEEIHREMRRQGLSRYALVNRVVKESPGISSKANLYKALAGDISTSVDVADAMLKALGLKVRR